ncbi:4-hydroxythreonine-4-phosphate dehydrogenase [Salipiger aestuarii]|uniref:4-hydroxythreonine-4-phosphate dehydrogenase n=1 Tax=Salipiger aestuarii TaxID=568098 RepID=A0A327XYB5_9RHOB|nr:4-hydroxythreonine-4-phosphate dehydrogenase PdxA [Salipiger aestuarii]EIE52968.1 4-hydroxythreonine-4-phosphate dehydrogenase [Citreicella sp. 357]KAA8606304.1 4-hydroxythreonine-4-phosphate dehydrogenase [Salipiger aestuarii]KAB2540969.1 4-hydroxythreonine-4-phosphate dehydrogenase [Salipiger aestuarii]RAK13141.1 4-hydroxythreonine-4-phosphate dehydrogenase [Salipiger aestuarii]
MTAAGPAPVALSCGEPSGIGPELAEAAWAALGTALPFVWIGAPAHLPGGVPHVIVSDPSQAAEAARHGLAVLAIDIPGPRVPGTPQPAQAAGVIDSIARGVALVQDGACSALCTLPISKQALAEGAGFAYPGHTEYLCALAGVDEVVMMLASDELRVVPATIHIALADVPAALTARLLEKRLRITRAALVAQFGITAPRIAVAGLNPHAGEGGRMGREELTLIIPVLDRLRAEGFDLIGPLPADTMFHARARAGYDAAVCMYHDQALIPIKTLAFDKGVNVTLGMPFVRTSPDHGTAFGIAGQGIADPSSTIEALKLARRLAGGAA